MPASIHDDGSAAGITLANWRTAPYSETAFWQVDRLIPAAAIAAPPHSVPLVSAGNGLAGFRFQHAGRELSLVELHLATHTDAWLVCHRGTVLDEYYRPPGDAARTHILFSLSKSVFGTLAGMLVDRGLLRPDAMVVDYVPEVAASAYGDATVRQVLDMTIATEFVENYLDQQGDYRRYRVATGWHPGDAPEGLHAFLATLRPGGRHGEVFRYRSPNSDLLGWILERAAGRPAAAILSDWLWQPLGAETPATITVDRYGAARAAGGISTSVRDLARIGLLMLCRGELNGRRILAADWVDDIMREGDAGAWQRGEFAQEMPAHCYRSQWYKPLYRPGVCFGLGIHGQVLYIDTAAELVVAKFASQPLPIDAAMDAMTIASCRALARELAG